MPLKCNKSRIFVKVVDIDWQDSPVNLDLLRIGDFFEVKILKYSEVPKKGGVQYLGSIKDASPEDDPWKKHEYTIGKIFAGSVSSLFESGAIISLDTGVSGLIRSSFLLNHLVIDQRVRVSIRSVNLARPRLELNLVEPDLVDDISNSTIK